MVDYEKMERDSKNLQNSLRMASTFSSRYGAKGAYVESDDNGYRARVISRAEKDDEDGTPPIFVSERGRDKLAFYGRQDTAHALLNSISLSVRLRRVERMLWALIALVILLVIVEAKR